MKSTIFSTLVDITRDTADAFGIDYDEITRKAFLEQYLQREESKYAVVKSAGGVTQIRVLDEKPQIYIKRIGRQEIYNNDGEVIAEFLPNTYYNFITNKFFVPDKIDNKGQVDKKNLYRTFEKLRWIIRANIKENHTLVCTLTYRPEAIKRNLLGKHDYDSIYDDFHAFWKRVVRYYKKIGDSPPEYISVVEPHGSGNFHFHLIMIFEKESPYLANEKLAELWGHGFVTVKALKSGVDDYGAYFTAYLSDLDLSELPNDKQYGLDGISVDKVTQEGKKKIIKGGRISFYPANMNIYRTSRGIKKPDVCRITSGEAMEMVKDKKLAYEKEYDVENNGKVLNHIHELLYK